MGFLFFPLILKDKNTDTFSIPRPNLLTTKETFQETIKQVLNLTVEQLKN